MRAQTPLTAASEPKRPCEEANPALSIGTTRSSHYVAASAVGTREQRNYMPRASR